MISPLLATVLLVLVTHVIDYIGRDVLAKPAYTLYLSILSLFSSAPSSSTPQSQQREVIRLRSDILQVKTEMLATSSQDEFAKWAKLRRKHDKLMAKFETKSKSSLSHEARFTSLFKSGLWIGTSGLSYLVRFTYRKHAVFWLPGNVFPRPVLWLLSFPQAPMGALSTFIWVSALERVISQITSLIVLGRQEYALWTVPTASSNLDESDSLKSSPRTATPLSPAL